MDIQPYHKKLSPCQSGCNLRGGNREYCTVCFRTSEEIVHWRTFSEKECHRTLAKVAQRKRDFGIS